MQKYKKNQFDIQHFNNSKKILFRDVLYIKKYYFCKLKIFIKLGILCSQESLKRQEESSK